MELAPNPRYSGGSKSSRRLSGSMMWILWSR